ncbi:Fe-S cluster assembly protein SufA [Tricladium varicosporioides]|nr:Fe-S cluster assembly protein SufA [Hymenoscyphus varicosporioides]
MSAQRFVAPLTSSTTFVFRFASSPATSAVRPCQHVLRTFSSSQAIQTSSKRKMQTSTAYQPPAYQPYPLNIPPQPRNVNVPDTSIKDTIPQVNDTRPPKLANQYEKTGNVMESEARVSLPEQEAQKSKSVTPPAPQARAKARPKLRARKAAMKLMPLAVQRLRALADQDSSKLLKVGVHNKGCSGLAYKLEYVERPGMLDEEVEQDGVRVIIDSKALMTIIGSEMDYEEGKLSQKFVFRNPNIKEQCGCGESFMV